MEGPALFACPGFCFLQLVDDLEHTVPANNRIIDEEFQSGGVFQDHRAANQALDAFAVLREEGHAALLLFGVAQDADEDNGRMEVAGDIDIVDGDQPGFAHREFAPDDFANLALQELAHSL